MDDEKLQVMECVVQKDFKNLQGRSVCMDCVIRDTRGRRYDVEIQQDKEGASPKRARYHSSLMDMSLLEPVQGFEELPESVVIFITCGDVYGEGNAICHVDRTIRETDVS